VAGRAAAMLCAAVLASESERSRERERLAGRRASARLFPSPRGASIGMVASMHERGQPHGTAFLRVVGRDTHTSCVQTRRKPTETQGSGPENAPQTTPSGPGAISKFVELCENSRFA
jgi:hypothetical protein